MAKDDIFLVTLEDMNGDTIVYDYNHAVRIKEQRKQQLLAKSNTPTNNRFLKFLNLVFNNLLKGV